MSAAAIVLREVRGELLKNWRMPGYTLPTLLFPLGFYVLFGLLLGRQGPGAAHTASYLLATYGAFGAMSAAMFGFAVALSAERAQGWLTLKRTTPMPLAAYFAAKFAVGVVFGLATAALLAVAGVAFGGVRFSAGEWAALFAVLAFGALPFGALGLLIGSLASPNASAPLVNGVMLPLSFLSGLWLPIKFLPPAIQRLAPFLPAYHFGQLALGVTGEPASSPPALHAAVLAGFTALFAAAAAFAWRRDESRAG